MATSMSLPFDQFQYVWLHPFVWYVALQMPAGHPLISLGIFQTYYKDTLGFSPSHVSWIGTIQLFLLFFVGVFSGRAVDAGYYRHTLVIGQVCQLIGVFTTSLCTEYYELLLSQGILQGLGNGLLFAPAVTLVSSYFAPNRRAFALSLLACGGATGGMVYPAIAKTLLPKMGFSWTVRCMGFVMLGTHVAVCPFLKPRPRGTLIKRSLLDPTAFRDVPYLLFCIGVFGTCWGIFFAFFYVRSYAREILHISDDTSFTLILIINSAGIPGRVIPCILADSYSDTLIVFVPFVAVTGVLLLVWTAVHSVVGYYVWVAVYGFWAGGAQSLFQAAASSFSDDPERLGIRIGMVCTVVSFACLSGAPIAGTLISARDGSYVAAQIFGGVVMLGGSVFLLAAKVALQKKRKASSLHRVL